VAVEVCSIVPPTFSERRAVLLIHAWLPVWASNVCSLRHGEDLVAALPRRNSFDPRTRVLTMALGGARHCPLRPKNDFNHVE
jgi:hypothetical protein